MGTWSKGTTDLADEGLEIPTRTNLYQAGLRCSPRLKEMAATSGTNRKARVTFGTTLLKAVSLFTLFSNVKDSIPSMPSYPVIPHTSFTVRAMHCFHGLNELYDNTVNQLHHFAFSTLDNFKQQNIHVPQSNEGSGCRTVHCCYAERNFWSRFTQLLENC